MMVLDKFGRHIHKHIYYRLIQKINSNIQQKTITSVNQVYDVKGKRLTGIKDNPEHNSDAVNLKYVSKIINNLEHSLKQNTHDIINQHLFVFQEKLDDKLKKNRSLIIINFMLHLDENVYKIENGNSDLFYTFPCAARIRTIRYNIDRLLVDTTVNDKSLSLVGHLVAANDKLKFIPIKGKISPEKVSVELILETELVL